MSVLLIDVLRSCVKMAKLKVDEFVVMPDHVHLLLTLPKCLSLEKAMQLIKNGFSFRVGKRVGIPE